MARHASSGFKGLTATSPEAGSTQLGEPVSGEPFEASGIRLRSRWRRIRKDSAIVCQDSRMLRRRVGEADPNNCLTTHGPFYYIPLQPTQTSSTSLHFTLADSFTRFLHCTLDCLPVTLTGPLFTKRYIFKSDSPVSMDGTGLHRTGQTHRVHAVIHKHKTRRDLGW